jgi:hypothetical protein
MDIGTKTNKRDMHIDKKKFVITGTFKARVSRAIFPFFSLWIMQCYAQKTYISEIEKLVVS